MTFDPKLAFNICDLYIYPFSTQLPFSIFFSTVWSFRVASKFKVAKFKVEMIGKKWIYL